MRDLYTWLSIAAIVRASVAGDILLARSMRQIGDLGELRRRRGLAVVLTRVLRSRGFLLGVACMALAFYGLLLALSWADVSLVGPASASLTFIANAIAGKIFLHEQVDHRRWMAALMVAGGVALLVG